MNQHDFCFHQLFSKITTRNGSNNGSKRSITKAMTILLTITSSNQGTKIIIHDFTGDGCFGNDPKEISISHFHELLPETAQYLKILKQFQILEEGRGAGGAAKKKRKKKVVKEERNYC